MRKKNTTGERPRRSRMPQVVYQVARDISHQLMDWEAKYPDDKFWKGRHKDEALCQEVAPILRELSSLALCKELDPETSAHPHKNPYECEVIVKAAMRFAWGLRDLIDEGKRVSKTDRLLCEELFGHFTKLRHAVEQSTKCPQSQGVSGEPKEEKQVVTGVSIMFALPAFGLFKGDTVYVVEDNTAPVGALIGIKGKETCAYYIARVCSNDARGIFVVDENDERMMLDDECEYSTFGPVTKIEKANAEKIAELKQRLAKLQEDDEHTLNITKCFEVEQEIFDLEHPLETEEEIDDEWPEEIGGVR